MNQKDQYHDITVGISVSPCKDAETIGYDQHQINRITIRIAQYWLFSGARVIFGHDWRDDGVMRAVAEFTEIACSNGSLWKFIPEDNEDYKNNWRMLNVAAVGKKHELSHYATDAESQSKGVFQVTTMQEAIDRLPNHNYPISLLKKVLTSSSTKENERKKFWLLREIITDFLSPGLRICLGGRTEDYKGYYAGVAEEAYLALLHQKPLYLIGGFGGATGHVCKALMGNYQADQSEATGLEWEPLNEPEENSPTKQRFPDEGLRAKLEQFGIAQLSKCNGLSEQENKQLFATTDIEFALDLISRGVKRYQEQ